jgi:hypothetical protein
MHWIFETWYWLISQDQATSSKQSRQVHRYDLAVWEGEVDVDVRR